MQGFGCPIRVAHLVEGVRVCLRRLGDHRKWLSIRLIQRIAGTAKSSPAISVSRLGRHRQRRPQFLAPRPRRPRRRAEHDFPGLPGLRFACRTHARHDGEDDEWRRARRRLAKGGEHGGGREGMRAVIIPIHSRRRVSCCMRRGRDQKLTLTSRSAFSQAMRRRQ